MAQAVHGSAPDIEHLHVANPTSLILSGKLLLDWLSERQSMPELGKVAEDVERAVSKTLAEGRALTPDLGGRANTTEMTQAILENVS
jgi:3-isopropylmalate dehydrogenase